MQGHWHLPCKFLYFRYFMNGSADWLSGRVLDSRLRGRGYEPHRRHCIVVLEQGVTALWSLSKTHLSKLSTGLTQEDPSLFN